MSLKGNRLLASLSGADLKRLTPNLETVALDPGRVLFEPQDRVTHAYFPCQGAVCLLPVGQDGTAPQAAMIGNEGGVGLGGALAGDVSFTRQVVQIPGHAARLARRPLLVAVGASETMRNRIMAHVDAFTAQNLQSVACSALHSVEQRLARWLLTALDRSGQATFSVTHRGLAELLAVQRTTITPVARAMDTAGFIRLDRGSITVLDRRGLEGLACECYGIIRRAYDEVHSAR